MAEETGQGPSSRLPVSSPAVPPSAVPAALSALGDVKVKVSVVLGRTELTLANAESLDEKSLLTVDRNADDPVDVCVNGKVVAHGKLVVVGDTYGVQITEFVNQERRTR